MLYAPIHVQELLPNTQCEKTRASGLSQTETANALGLSTCELGNLASKTDQQSLRG